MDALSSTDIIPGRKKRKISTVTATKSSTSTAAVAPVSPDDKKAAPPSVCQFVFYFLPCSAIANCGYHHSLSRYELQFPLK